MRCQPAWQFRLNLKSKVESLRKKGLYTVQTDRLQKLHFNAIFERVERKMDENGLRRRAWVYTPAMHPEQPGSFIWFIWYNSLEIASAPSVDFKFEIWIWICRTSESQRLKTLSLGKSSVDSLLSHSKSLLSHSKSLLSHFKSLLSHCWVIQQGLPGIIERLRRTQISSPNRHKLRTGQKAAEFAVFTQEEGELLEHLSHRCVSKVSGFKTSKSRNELSAIQTYIC